MTPINVSIVSDVRLHCDGLAILLSQWPVIRVLGAHTMAEAPIVIERTHTEVALLDMPRPSIARFLGLLRGANSSPHIIAIGVRTASDVLTCAAAGIAGFVGMDAPVADMVSTIERVARRATPGVDLSGRFVPSVALTIRELQIADLLNLGLGNKEIANRLGVEPCTVKNHVHNIMHKLGVHRRGAAVARLRELIAERFSSPVGT
jgi:DNA-binding NarL/FixJ family response regulator